MSLQIFLDKPYYAPGSKVTGTVVADINRPQKARSIFVDVVGAANTSFTKHRHGYNDSSSHYDHFSGEQTYINFRVKVWQPTDGTEVINPGKYRCQFSFIIPQGCPPNFEGTYGSIRYSLKAELDIPWAFNLKTSCGFTVLSTQSTTSIMSPISSYVSKNNGFCSNKPLGCQVIIPKAVFATGEKIPITLNINNSGGSNIEGIVVAIKSFVIFHGRSNDLFWSYSSSEEDTILSHETLYPHYIKEDQLKATLNLTLHLTANVPTIQNCAIINVINYLHVKLRLPGIFTSDLRADIPITIVTASLQNVIVRQRSSSPKTPQKSKTSTKSNVSKSSGKSK